MMPVARGWGSGGLQVSLSTLQPGDRLKVIDPLAPVPAPVIVAVSITAVPNVTLAWATCVVIPGP